MGLSLMLNIFLSGSKIIAKSDAIKSNDFKFIDSIVLPALIAVGGYLVKSLYDIYLDNRKRRFQNIEDKLKLFYWPILIRLEKDNGIWETILLKRQDSASIQYKIAEHIEKNIVLKNHQEVLDIIDNYAYLAEPDDALQIEIKNYIKNVTIYKAIRESDNQTQFPLALGAPWPKDFYPIIKEKTKFYQEKLNSKSIVRNM